MKQKIKLRHPEKFKNPVNPIKKKPDWIRSKLINSKEFFTTKTVVNRSNLVTVCQEANCPNITECWSKRHATFMIMGDTCTRACAFCDVKTGKPEKLDPFEDIKIANAVKKLNLRHVVITSVDRDDLPDMGSILWAETVQAVRRLNPNTTMETLIPDFQGIEKHIDRIVKVMPEVVSHNMETVRRLTREVRIQAKYDQSLGVLKYLKQAGVRRTKSGIMLGLGETEEEVKQTMLDLREAEVDIVTIGQYLQPSKKHLPVKEFITPDQFKIYEEYGKQIGFRHVESGALVRSSYKAEKHLE